MALDSTELRVGVTGNLYVAATSATPPATTTDPWTGWIDLGLLSDDGPTMTPSMDTTEIPVWQSFYAARRIVTGRGLEWAFTLMQRNADTMKLAFGGGTVVAGTQAGDWIYTPPTPETIDERAFGLEVREGTIVDRYILPRGMVTGLGDVPFKRTEATRFDLTIAAVGSDTADPWYMISNDAAMNPA
jgi:hypothetical protein